MNNNKFAENLTDYLGNYINIENPSEVVDIIKGFLAENELYVLEEDTRMKWVFEDVDYLDEYMIRLQNEEG